MNKVLMMASVASMIEQFNMGNIDLLRKEGYEVHVAANFEYGSTTSKQHVDEFKKELEQMKIPCYQIDFSRNITNLFTNVKAYNQIKDLMKKNKYKFVHCHSPIGGVCGRLAGRSTNTSVMYTAHGFHFYKGAPITNWLLYYPIEKFLAKYTSCLITINEEDYNVAISKNLKSKAIKKINGVGINTSKFSPISEKEKSKLRQEYGYSENDFVLIYPAELNANKNQSMIIETISLLKEEIPNVRLLLPGSPTLKKEYEELIERLNIQDRVEILGFRADIKKLIQLSDISISTSKREGLPVNIIEAMGCGKPVIATNIRGHNELVENGKGGYLVELEDAKGFAKAILSIYNNPTLRERMGMFNIENVKKYDVEMIKREMASIYSEM